MTDLRREIEEIMSRNCYRSYPVDLVTATTELEELFEKRLEPLRKYQYKYKEMIKIMRREKIVFNGSGIDGMEKMAFTLYSEMVQMCEAIRETLGEKGGGE
jgi:hypothetical protein